MLDVHPPEHAAHSWRDFFIHIATIVVGLIIAVGIEQTVEAIHHRMEVHEARERIHEEVEVNQRILRNDLTEIDTIINRLRHNRDLALNSGASASSQTLDLSWNLQMEYESAYNRARESGVLNLLPYGESAMYADAYENAEVVDQRMLRFTDKIGDVKGIVLGRPLSSLNSAERNDLAAGLSDAIGKADWFKGELLIQQREWNAVSSGRFRNDIGGTYQ